MLEQLTLLNRISDELNKDLDPDKMLRRVLDLTASYLDASTGSVMLFDAENRVSAFILQQEDISDARANRIVGQVLTEGFAGWMLSHGKGDVIHDTRQDNRWMVYANQPYDVRSVIGHPLRRRQRIIGVLTLVHDEPHHFNEESLPLLGAIAAQAAIALENARLFKETEQERRTLSTIITNTQDAVLLTTFDDKVLLLNPAARDIMGLSHEADITAEQPLAALTDNPDLLQLLSPNTPMSGEVSLSDGRTMWANVTDIPGMGRVSVLHDISTYKALDKMKREFVTAFTHDLRTPLATVKGYVELLRMDGSLTERQEEDLQGITRAAHLMKTLVEDLLELSRLERLEELVREKLLLTETIGESLNAAKLPAHRKNIELVLETPSNEPLYIEGNQVLLERAIGNLLDNAIKYTPEGGQVRVRLSRNNGNALIAVSDNGPGIRAKDLPRVFEKFFRARSELDETPGSGLGLPIVKIIAEHHYGQVWAESQPDQGSTFTIALPLFNS